jgi:putative photosynthetic complex assembly protein
MTAQKSAPVHFPRFPLMAAFAFLFAAVAVIGGARLAGFSPVQDLGATEVIQGRTLRFEDAADGSVKIIDADTNIEIAAAGPGTNGFLRGALRGLMRARKREDVSYLAPFRLERWSNGQLMLIDTAEGGRIDLNAYGRTNAAVFNEFLTTTGDKS